MIEEPQLYINFGKNLYRLETEKVEFKSDIDPDRIISGSSISTIGQALGLVYSGKTGFNNDETGYILGNDEGVQKFYIGTGADYFNFDGTNVIVSGTLSAGAIDIGGSDATSFHVDSSGNMWLGAATFATGTFAVSSGGVVSAESITLETNVVIKDLQSGSVIDGEYINSLNVSRLVTGTISSKQITLGITGGAGDVYIGGGTFDAATWTCTGGFLLGLDDSDADKGKFFVGNSSSNVNFDGTNTTVTGVLNLVGTLQLKGWAVADLPLRYLSGAPTALDTLSEWTNPTNAYTSNDAWATAGNALYQEYKTFGLGTVSVPKLPAGSTINGIEVLIECHGDAADMVISAALSWDSGVSYTSSQIAIPANGADSVKTLGTPTFKWGHTWLFDEIADEYFQVRIFSADIGSGTLMEVDYIQVKVYYTDPKSPLAAGSIAYASDGRKAGEGAGNGTGVLVFYDENDTWIACDTGTTVDD